jgi:enoyl-CoA hydratase/carnithine racemase
MIHQEQRGDVTVLRIEHGKVNAIDLDLCADFSNQLEGLIQQNVRSVVLTAKGSTFSAGVDLVRLAEGGRPYIEKFLPALTDVLVKLFAFPRPIIAAVNGHALAGGFILSCACDVRIAIEGSCRIGMPELLVGVPLPAIVMEILRFAIPAPQLAQLAYFGRAVTPVEALRMNILDEVVPENHLIAHAFRTANQMATIPDKAFKITKRELRAPYIERFERERAKLDAEVLETWCSAQTLDAIKSYIARSFQKKCSPPSQGGEL